MLIVIIINNICFVFVFLLIFRIVQKKKTYFTFHLFYFFHIHLFYFFHIYLFNFIYLFGLYSFIIIQILFIRKLELPICKLAKFELHQAVTIAILREILAKSNQSAIHK